MFIKILIQPDKITIEQNKKVIELESEDDIKTIFSKQRASDIIDLIKYARKFDISELTYRLK